MVAHVIVVGLFVLIDLDIHTSLHHLPMIQTEFVDVSNNALVEFPGVVCLLPSIAKLEYVSR